MDSPSRPETPPPPYRPASITPLTPFNTGEQPVSIYSSRSYGSAQNWMIGTLLIPPQPPSPISIYHEDNSCLLQVPPPTYAPPRPNVPTPDGSSREPWRPTFTRLASPERHRTRRVYPEIEPFRGVSPCRQKQPKASRDSLNAAIGLLIVVGVILAFYFGLRSID